MTWKYRRDGSWQPLIPKKRESGRWRALNSGDDSPDEIDDTPDEAPKRFYTEGPPNRSGETIIYDGNSHSSLQAAYESLTEGDTLYIDPSNSPYSDRLILDQNPTNHVTIESDGAKIVQPDMDRNYVIGMDNSHLDHPADASLVGSHGNGDEWIEVSDTSPFSVGDDIHITEHRRPWGEPASGGASGADTTHEYRTITGINGGELELSHPLFMPFPNKASTDVGVMEWNVEDICLFGFDAESTGDSDSEPLWLRGGKKLWLENMEISEGGYPMITVAYGYRCSFHDIHMQNGSKYGLTTNHGTTHTHITNISSDNIGRYTCRQGVGGGESRNTVDMYAETIKGTDMDYSIVAQAHWGGFFVEFYDVTAGDDNLLDGGSSLAGDGSRLTRHRSRHITLDGFVENGSGRHSIAHAQRPHTCTVKNGKIKNKHHGGVQSKARVFYFPHSTDDSGSKYGNEKAVNITFENIEIEAYEDMDITDIGYFSSDGNCVIDGLHFKNIYYDGQKLERSHVEQWKYYDINKENISNLVVE